MVRQKYELAVSSPGEAFFDGFAPIIQAESASYRDCETSFGRQTGVLTKDVIPNDQVGFASRRPHPEIYRVWIAYAHHPLRISPDEADEIGQRARGHRGL